MVRREIFQLVDDLDGSGADETVTFALDGMNYTIDLSQKNADALREMLEPYTAAATRLGRVPTAAAARTVPRGRRGSAPTNVVRHVTDREYNTEVRRWAKAEGIPISDRGRIPQDVIDRFEAQRSGSGPTPSFSG